MAITVKKPRVPNTNRLKTNLARAVNNAAEEVANDTIDFTRQFYLQQRKKMVHDLIVQSIRIDSAGFSNFISSVRIHIGGNVAPYAIFVDQGFRSRSGQKVFDGYHFSTASREYAIEITPKILDKHIWSAITGGL